jgi:hypothetical protein
LSKMWESHLPHLNINSILLSQFSHYSNSNKKLLNRIK